MNKKTGIIASLVTLAAVAAFALCMIFDRMYGSYLASMFIAWGFVTLICAFAAFGGNRSSALSKTATAFASIYAVLIMLVYFSQLTTVRMGSLNEQAAQLLDYTKFGLMFNYDLLGYAFMALATFFIAFSVQVRTTADKWLKGLLLGHGAFAVCLVIPMLGLFDGQTQGGDIMGIMILEFWCAYFIPVCILSHLHFIRKDAGRGPADTASPL